MKKQFKAESQRLLDMMINSIYTHKEIFLRELISKASDAIDKLHFKSLTDDNIIILDERINDIKPRNTNVSFKKPFGTPKKCVPTLELAGLTHKKTSGQCACASPR